MIDVLIKYEVMMIIKLGDGCSNVLDFASDTTIKLDEITLQLEEAVHEVAMSSEMTDRRGEEQHDAVDVQWSKGLCKR